jgi:nicotinamide riboside kinase
MFEQLIIMKNQNIRDKAIASVSHVMLSDTPAVASYIFGVRLLKRAMRDRGYTQKSPAQYKYLEELYLECLKTLDWFDLVIVFPPTDAVVLDGTRTETMDDKLAIYNAIKGFLDCNDIPYVVIEGDTQAKIDQVMMEILARI